ncbi:MAG TPA: alpha/beta hydrolase [Solirubrobacteraceae bacterium]|nr:alpha/beta hydrolase [Solirubrobacteraceae bacterium]
MQSLLRERRIELGGYQTRALELDGDGAPIVFLHGFADSADTWRRAMGLLGRRGQRAVALDLPGFGTATPLDLDEPVMPQLDRFAVAAIEHVAGQHGPVVLSGNSLGGCVALRLAERDGLPLAAVAPVAPAGLDMPVWLMAIERDPIVRGLLAIPFPLPEILVRTAVGEAYRNLAFARPRAVPGEVVSAFTSHVRNRVTAARYLTTAQRMLPELRDPFRLAQISCPVLLVWGERDRMVTHRGAQRVTDALPHTTYELIRGCGHCPQVEEPDRFVDILLRFVGALDAGDQWRRPA